MFPEISDYLKSTVGSNISNLVQPDKIAAATIFLLLNLGNIILNLSNFSAPGNPLHPLFDTFLTMDPLLQGSVDIVIIITLAYLLLSFNTAIMKVFTGEAWIETWPAGLCKKLQMRRRNRLIHDSKGGTLNNDLANQQLITSFAQEQTDDRPTALDIYPTALGNVQSATVSYIYNHYGIEMAALWPHMESVVEAVDITLSKRIDNEKAALDFLLNMSFLSIIFAIELIVQSFILFSKQSILWIAIPIILAAITYQGAVLKARTWGDVVQVTFDMHRDELRQKLGVRPPTSLEDEREVWQRVSKLLLWGKPANDAFVTGTSADKSSGGTVQIATGGSSSVPKTAKAATNSGASDEKAAVKTFTSIEADIHSIVVNLDTPDNAKDLNISTDDNLMIINQYIDYFLAVRNTSDQEIKDVFLYITDARIPIIYIAPVARNIEGKALSGVHATIIPQSSNNGCSGKQLIWSIDCLEAGKSLLICYRLPGHMFVAVANTGDLRIEQTASRETLSPDTGAIDYTITIVANTPGKMSGNIEVFDTRKTLPDGIKFGCLWYDRKDDPQIIAAKKLSEPERYRWNITPTDPNNMSKQVTLTYTV